MRVFVNDREIELLPGMKVRHALIHEDLLDQLASGKICCDEWGNEIGIDGALVEDARIYVCKSSCRRGRSS